MMVYVRSLTVSSVRPSFTLFYTIYELLDNGMGKKGWTDHLVPFFFSL